MFNININDRIVFHKAEPIAESLASAASLLLLDQGGMEIGRIIIFVDTPEAFIELGHDLVLAGEQLAQDRDEWPETKMTTEDNKLTTKGNTNPDLTTPDNIEADYVSTDEAA
jgi:hypothetical protein